MTQFQHLMALKRLWWPGVRFWDKEVEIIRSVQEYKETYLVSANKMGKDYTAGWIVLTFFMAPWLYFPAEVFLRVEERRKREVLADSALAEKPHWLWHTRRIVTTSVDGDQLRNLWGEIGRFIQTSKRPISSDHGGPLTVNMRDITFSAERWGAGSADPLNYLIGRVTATGEGISGAHAEYNMMVIDEASSSSDVIYEFAQGWAKKFLVFGNPNQCENFFKRAVKGGSVRAAA